MSFHPKSITDLRIGAKEGCSRSELVPVVSTGTERSRLMSNSALGLQRALLHTPQYLFLDEATASLDEPSEAALYRLLEANLPATTIVSIGHRSTLNAFHQPNVRLARDGDRFVLQDGGESVRPS